MLYSNRYIDPGRSTLWNFCCVCVAEETRRKTNEEKRRERGISTDIYMWDRRTFTHNYGTIIRSEGIQSMSELVVKRKVSWHQFISMHPSDVRTVDNSDQVKCREWWKMCNLFNSRFRWLEWYRLMVSMKVKGRGGEGWGEEKSEVRWRRNEMKEKNE